MSKIQSDERVSSISGRLQFYLKEHHLKQADLVRMCQPYCKKYDIRIQKNDISHYILGKASPNQERLTILSKALNVPETWLLGYNVPQIVPERLSMRMSKIPDFLKSYCFDFDFVLEATDDSLFSDHIYKGDLVYFKKQTVVESGDLIAVLIDSEEMIRRVFYHKDKKIMILKTSNSHDDLIIHTDRTNVLGKAVAFTSKNVKNVDS